jgi:ribonuclease HI
LRDGRELRRRRMDLGPWLTNNEAEYQALIVGLGDTLRWLAGQGLDPAQEALEVRGDSQLVMRQLQGVWKAREPRMAALRDRALALLRRFGRYDLHQVPRKRSLEVLAH